MGRRIALVAVVLVVIVAAAAVFFYRGQPAVRPKKPQAAPKPPEVQPHPLPVAVARIAGVDGAPVQGSIRLISREAGVGLGGDADVMGRALERRSPHQRCSNKRSPDP